MSIEFALDTYPKDVTLKGDLTCTFRPISKNDESKLHLFFLQVPKKELIFIKHRVTELEVVRTWCQKIDFNHKCTLLALHEGHVIGNATLHQNQGGWKSHIGRVSALVHPEFRGHGVFRGLVTELISIARMSGLERVEAEFIGEQEGAMKAFALLGFSHLLRLEKYVKDMKAKNHDYVLMGLKLRTDEEYAGMG